MPWRCARSRTSVSACRAAPGQVEARELELHAPGLDLRQVEDVVDQREQVLARGRGCPAGTPSCLAFSSPNMRSVSTSEKPMMALSGVRSSCDMLARNSDLCWLATSSCAALVLDLVEQARVLRSRSRPGRRSVRMSVDHPLVERRRGRGGTARCPAPTSPPIIGTVSTARSPPREPLPERIVRDRLHVADLDRLAASGSPARWCPGSWRPGSVHEAAADALADDRVEAPAAPGCTRRCRSRPPPRA